jgi:transposase
LANGINANMLRKWVIDEKQAVAAKMDTGCAAAPITTDVHHEAVPAGSGFVALECAPAATLAVSPESIQVEVHRAGMTATVTWPVNAAAECAAWLRELLR